MNPATTPQSPELNPRTAYLWVSTTGKNWRLDWGPPGRRRLPHRSREGVSEAVATRQTKSDPRSIVPARRGTKGRQADGTARARTRGNRRPGASPPSRRDERDARCKRIPRPNGRRTRHTPRGADVSRTHPVSPHRTSFGRREVASGDVGPARCPTLESSPFRAGRMSMLLPSALHRVPNLLVSHNPPQPTHARHVLLRRGGTVLPLLCSVPGRSSLGHALTVTLLARPGDWSGRHRSPRARHSTPRVHVHSPLTGIHACQQGNRTGPCGTPVCVPQDSTGPAFGGRTGYPRWHDEPLQYPFHGQVNS